MREAISKTARSLTINAVKSIVADIKPLEIFEMTETCDTGNPVLI